MKILAISHSCVVDINQQVFVALNDLPDVEVMLLIPATWKSEYTGETMTPKLLKEVTFPVLNVPVAKAGNVSLYFFTSLPIPEIARFAPDIVLSTQEPWSISNLQAMWIAHRLGVPFAFQTNQNIYKPYPFPFSFFETTAYRRAAIAMAYSEEARQVMVRKGLIRPSAVVPYATDTRRFQPADSQALRQRLGIDGATVVGYMGRFVAAKGLDTLIDAVAKLHAQGTTRSHPVKLLFVGAGEQEAELRQRLATAGLSDHAVFTGTVPHTEAGNYMNCMDIFVLPSRTMPNWKEQFGRVIIEALACDVPVVGSDSGQIPVLIRETGGGLVFREGDVDSLAQSLQELILSPEKRQALARQGRQIVAERFTCEAVATQLHQLFAPLTMTGKGRSTQG